MQDINTILSELVPWDNIYLDALGVVVLSGFLAIVVIPFVDGLIAILTGKTETDLDDKLRAAVRWPMIYLVVLFGVVYAVTLLEFGETITHVMKSGLYSLMVVVISKGTLRVIRVLLTHAVGSSKIKTVNEQTFPLWLNASFVLISAVALYALFLVWNIDVTAWLASAGILGIAIGFAAKDTLSNLISGVFIFTDKPYSVGDYILLQSGMTGIVSNVGLRSTRIRTFDDEEVTIPNGTIANEALTNKSTGPDTGRVKVNIGVAYGTNPRDIESLLLNIARENDMILGNPEPSVRFINFGDSSLDFQLSCRVQDPLDVYATQSELRYAIVTRFAEKNIEIPFPQRDIHMKS